MQCAVTAGISPATSWISTATYRKKTCGAFWAGSLFGSLRFAVSTGKSFRGMPLLAGVDVMKICLGDLIQSEFGTGPVVALTNEWVVHDTGDGHEAALPKDEGGFWVPVTEFGPHGSKQQQTRQSIEDEAKGNFAVTGGT